MKTHLIAAAVLLIIWAFWDVTLCHWECSSQHFEGPVNFQNIKNYLLSDTESHPIMSYFIYQL